MHVVKFTKESSGATAINGFHAAKGVLFALSVFRFHHFSFSLWKEAEPSTSDGFIAAKERPIVLCCDKWHGVDAVTR